MPEVVGVPPGDLVEQVRFGSAVHGRGRLHRVLELCGGPARLENSGRNCSLILSSGSGRPVSSPPNNGYAESQAAKRICRTARRHP